MLRDHTAPCNYMVCGPFKPFILRKRAERSRAFMTLYVYESSIMPDALDSAERGFDVDSTGTPTVTPDGAFEALADPRRRAVLATLHERQDESVTVEALVDAVVSHDTGDSGPKARRRVAASLTAVHLPELDDWGLVEFDTERRTVRYTDSPLIEGLLERAEKP